LAKVVIAASENYKFGGQTVAALALIAANAGMLFIWFLYDLSLFQVVLVYWWEALWIGLFSGLKLLTASLIGSPFENRWIDVSRGSGLFITLFSIIKSGGAFLIILMLTGVALVVAQETLTGTPGNDFVGEQGQLLLKCSLVFVAGHGLSFIINFLLLGEFRHARFSTLLWLPFRRSLGLFVTIIAALTAIQTYPGVLTANSFAAILISAKLVWDYFLHRRERRSLQVDGPA
jgi:hypothetical protein